MNCLKRGKKKKHDDEMVDDDGVSLVVFCDVLL